MIPKEGYLYVATGSKYIEEAEQSLISLRKHFSDAHATLFTDNLYKTKLFNQVIVLNNEKNNSSNFGKKMKITGLLNSPYQKTIFLDTDTYFCDSCSELFTLLDHFDFMIAQAPADKRLVQLEGKEIIGYYPYNSGVIAFNKNIKTNNLFKDWLSIYIDKFNIYYGDQPALMEALLTHELKIYVLQNIYNFRIPYYSGIINGKVKIIHGRTDNFNLIEKELNSNTEHRGWNPLSKKINNSLSEKNKYYNIRKIINKLLR